MQRRYLVTALALVVALVAITPTLGSTSRQRVVEKSTFPVRTAKKAKEIAKRAKAIAREANATAAAAQTAANDAVNTANGAQNTANGAAGTADQAKATADATAAELAGLRAKTASAAGTVTTAEENAFVDLGGPSVTVTVPASGLIEVAVQALMDDDAALALFEDGQQVPGQDPNDFCQTAGGNLSPLLANDSGGGGPLTLSTGSITFVCGSVSPPVPVLFKTNPGQHTYDLRYADCGCSAADAELSNRTLTVAPRP